MFLLTMTLLAFFLLCILIVYFEEWKSKTQVTSSNPRVRRLKARVVRLKARVARLKARVEAIKPRVK